MDINTRHMKVIHYIPTLDRNSGGLGSSIQLLSRELGKIVDLHVITHNTSNLLKIDNATLHIIEGRLSHIYKTKKEFISLLAKISPDIIHINCCWYPQCSLLQKWAQKLGYKVVLTPHGMLEPWILNKNKYTKKIPALILYQKRAIKKADTIIATAESEKRNVLSLGLNDKVKVIPNGISIEGIECKKTWNKSKSILFLALLRPNKGAHLLIEAASIIKKQLEGWKIIIAGKDDEEYENYLKKLVIEKDLNEIVHFSGFISGENKWEMYRNADLFVLPTLNENFGLVIAESLLCGTPVITCKGAPWESLVKENCGWWIERDIKQITLTLKKAIELNENELKLMGINGRNYVITHFDSKIISQKLLDLYSSISK